MRYIFKNRFYILLISVIDFLGNLIFLPFRLFKRRAPGNIAAILVIRLDHIGDVIGSTAVAQNLKEHYRGAKITFLVGNDAKEIIMNNPYVDEILCYDAPWFDRSERKVFGLIRLFKLAKELRKGNYDLGFDLRGDFRHIVLMALAGIKFKVGYGITGGGFLLHRQADYREGVNFVEHNLDMLRDMGINIVNDRPMLYSSDEDKRLIAEFLQENDLRDKDRLVVIHPCAGYPSKNWLDERFAELADRMYEDYNAKIVLIGSEKDKKRLDNIVNMARKARIINASEKLSLGSLPELIKRACVFIGIDSAPAHIAALTYTPAVILYSGTNDFKEWVVRSDKSIMMQKDISCKGCGILNCQQNICMDLISVEDVLEAVKRIAKL